MTATTASPRTDTVGMPASPWQDFTAGRWTERIDVRDFIQANVTPYTGDAAFLAGPHGAHPRAVVSADRDVP